MAVSLSWSISVSNTSATEAKVSVTLKAKSTNGSYNLNNPSGYITIDGTKYTFSHDFKKNTTTTLATKSKTIARTTSSKSVAIKAYFKTGVSSGNISKSGSTTVSARPTYTVTFNANGGSAGTTSKTVYYGYTTTFPSAGSRTGYTFGSWGGYAAGAATPAITSSRTYTASWNLVTYSISYTLNGGSISEQKTSYNVTTDSFTLPTPTRTGYDFAGWTGSNGSTTQTSVTISKGSTGNKSYTANWDIKKYTVTLNPNGGTIDTTSLTKTHGTNLTLPSPSYVDATKIFTGWNTAQDGSGASYTTVYSTDVSTTLYAQWSANATRITLYYYGSATDINNTSMAYKIQSENLDLSSITPSLKNYVFKGWYTDTDYTTQITAINSDSNIPTALYAKWAKLYTVKYNINTLQYNDGIEPEGNTNITIVEDGVSTPLDFKAYYKVNISSGNPHSLGYYELDEGGIYVLTEDTTINLENPKTYYEIGNFKYIDYNEYNIVSNPVIGNISTYYEIVDGVYQLTTDVSINNEKTYYTRDTVAKCNFTGWTDGTTTYTSTGSSSITLTGRTEGFILTLQAVWTPVKYTATFTPGEGADYNSQNYVIQNINYHTYIANGLPTANLVASSIHKSGYYLSGWKSNNVFYEISSPYLVKKNVTFEAQWTYSYISPNFTITITRTSDESGNTPAEDGQYIKIHLNGNNGAYITGGSELAVNYSYEIKIEFLDDAGGIVETRTKAYDHTTRALNGATIIKDRKYKFVACNIYFIDTTDYGYTVNETARIFTYNGIIPLKRNVGVHIADDLKTISLFDEIADGDTGLVVHGPITMVDDANNTRVSLNALIQIVRW